MSPEQKYFIHDEHGNRVRMRTRAELNEIDREETKAKARADYLAKSLVPPNTTPPAARFVQFAQEQLDRAVLPADKASAKARLAMAKKFANKEQVEIDKQQRLAEHAANPSVRLARENCSGDLALMYPHASRDDIEMATAIANSDALSADEIATRYWAIIQTLADNEAAVAKRKADDAHHAVLAANVAASEASLAAKEAELKAVQVQQ